MSDSESETEEPVEVLLVPQEILSSPDDPPMSEWSSLEISIPEENVKKLLYSQELYSPGSGEICTKFICASDSSMFIHAYYNYPAVANPGIIEALTLPEKPAIYPDDGQALYLHLCEEMKLCPVRMFHKNLLNSEINVSWYGLNNQGVRAMAKALQFNKHVTRLDLTGNFLNDDACYHLGRMLASNTTIIELIMNRCQIGASGIHRLGDTLPINRSLMFLDLANNNLGERGGLNIAKQLYDGATVKRLCLSNNKLGKETSIALADVWDWKNRFTYLDLSWNDFCYVPASVKMLNNLALSVDLEELNLSFTGLEGVNIATAIAKVLLIPTLKAINLSNNRFHGEAVEIIIANLLNAPKLQKFNLSFNPLTPHDAFLVLQKMLRTRVKIKELLLENICVEKSFIDLLAKVKRMKIRKNFVCVFDTVLHNWSVMGPDARELILKRAQFIGDSSKKHKLDIALYFLALAKENPKPIATKDLEDRATADKAPLHIEMIEQLSYVFAGPQTRKTRTINLLAISEYVHRLWPDKKLPPTPPPEPEPDPEPEPEPPPPKAKKGRSKKSLHSMSTSTTGVKSKKSIQTLSPSTTATTT